MSEIFWYELNMTSNTAPSPLVASASSATGTYPVWKVFNGTTVGSDDRWRSSDNSSSNLEWIQLDFGKKTPVDAFEVTAVNYATTLDGTPKTYSLLGSDDNLSWENIGDFQTSDFAVNESKVFTLSSLFKFRYYRLNVSDRQGSVNYFNIGDVKFGNSIINKTLILHDGEYKSFKQRTIPTLRTIPSEFMTTYSNSELTVSASYERSGNEAWKVFNGSEASVVGQSWYAGIAPTESTHWLKFEFANPCIINGMTIRNTSYSGNTSSLNSFTLYGSDDDIDYVRIFSGTKNNDFVNQTFEFENNEYYKYYKLSDLTSHATGTALYSGVGISELSFIGTDEIIDEEVGWVSVSSTTPTAQQFLDEGMDSLSPLLDRRVETLELLKMVDKSNILLAEGEGKIFSKTINSKKYLDIRSVKVEVE